MEQRQDVGDEHEWSWRGGGDIDAVAISPTGVAVVIEIKTRTYEAHHLARVREQAAWLSRRRHGWARSGVLAVVCLVRGRGIERVQGDVLVVSIDQLTHVLRLAAEMAGDARSAGSDLSVPPGSHLEHLWGRGR